MAMAALIVACLGDWWPSRPRRPTHNQSPGRWRHDASQDEIVGVTQALACRDRLAWFMVSAHLWRRYNRRRDWAYISRFKLA